MNPENITESILSLMNFLPYTAQWNMAERNKIRSTMNCNSPYMH
jgi:hypothetical protein